MRDKSSSDRHPPLLSDGPPRIRSFAPWEAARVKRSLSAALAAQGYRFMTPAMWQFYKAIRAMAVAAQVAGEPAPTFVAADFTPHVVQYDGGRRTRCDKTRGRWLKMLHDAGFVERIGRQYTVFVGDKTDNRRAAELAVRRAAVALRRAEKLRLAAERDAGRAYRLARREQKAADKAARATGKGRTGWTHCQRGPNGQFGPRAGAPS